MFFFIQKDKQGQVLSFAYRNILEQPLKMDWAEIDILRWVLIFLWAVFVWENYLSYRQVNCAIDLRSNSVFHV